MVGEIRDGETADLAIQAALTGHVVLSTLHTNNAATSLPRLLDMGAEPFLIASTVNTVIGQRLVRRLCPDCRVLFVPEGEEITAIKRNFDLESGLKILGEIKDGRPAEPSPVQSAEPSKSDGGKRSIKPINETPGGKSILDEIAADPNIVDRPLKADPADEPKTKTAVPAKEPARLKPGQFTLYKAGGGCQTCGGLGYQSRVGIYEVLNVGQVIQRMIVGRATASEIQDQAVKEGMLTMQQDGFVKALMGLTTIEEVLRVTRE
jgi:type IV pilus assembly protein PilB